MECLVSIVVPIYNVEKYLNKCIKSILNQSYTNFELILVNDGSPDKSHEICEKWKSIDNRIVYISKINGGVSSARNEGVQRSKGKYVMFVDADDWLERCALETLVNKIYENDADFCFSPIECVSPFRTLVMGENEEEVCLLDDDGESDVEYFNKLVGYVGPCAKLFKKSIIDEFSISFPIEVRYGEDQIFLWRYLFHCRLLVSAKNATYFYSQLNYSSACRKYYPDNNIWKISLLETVISFFSTKKILNSGLFVNQFILMTFQEVCLEYCYYLEDRDFAKKFLETIRLFEPYLKQTDKVVFGKRYLNIDKYFCDEVKKDVIINVPKNKKIKNFLRNILVFFARNIYYR